MRKDLEKMRFTEFIVYMMYDDSFCYSELEQFNYIRKITNNFDEIALEIFSKELNFLAGGIKYTFPDIKDEDFVECEKEVPILEFVLKVENYLFVQKKQSISELPEDTKIQVLQKYIDERAALSDIVIHQMNPELKILYVQKLILNFDPDCNFRRRFESFIRFSRLFERLYEKHTTKTSKRGELLDIKTLEFKELFVAEFSGRIEELVGLLKTNGYIDNEHSYQLSKKKELALIYYYLEEKKVTTNLEKYIAIKSFYAYFGMVVYKDNNPNEIPTNRKVSMRGLHKEGCYLDSETLKKFNIQFSSLFISKV